MRKGERSARTFPSPYALSKILCQSSLAVYGLWTHLTKFLGEIFSCVSNMRRVGVCRDNLVLEVRNEKEIHLEGCCGEVGGGSCYAEK